MAGHDINYLAVSGILSTLGRKHENPIAPSKFIVLDDLILTQKIYFHFLSTSIARLTKGVGQSWLGIFPFQTDFLKKMSNIMRAKEINVDWFDKNQAD